jgi:uncharacterized membrane protein
MNWAVRADVATALAVMAATTVLCRAGGFFLMRYVTITPRVRRMMDALPGSIIVAAALPVVVNSGVVAMFAIGAAVAVTIVRRNDFLTVITGMSVAAAARWLGLGG